MSQSLVPPPPPHFYFKQVEIIMPVEAVLCGKYFLPIDLFREVITQFLQTGWQHSNIVFYMYMQNYDTVNCA